MCSEWISLKLNTGLNRCFLIILHFPPLPGPLTSQKLTMMSKMYSCVGENFDAISIKTSQEYRALQRNHAENTGVSLEGAVPRYQVLCDVGDDTCWNVPVYATCFF